MVVAKCGRFGRPSARNSSNGSHIQNGHSPTLALICVASPLTRVRGASRASRRRRTRTSRASSQNTRDYAPRCAPRARMIRVNAFAPVPCHRHSSTHIAPAFIDARAYRAHAHAYREMIAFAAPSTRRPASRGRASDGEATKARVRRAAVLRPRAAAAPSSAPRGDGTRAAAVTREQCVEFIRSGCKPKSAFRCVREARDARATRGKRVRRRP